MRAPASASASRKSSSTRRRIWSAAVLMRFSVARMRSGVLSRVASSCAASPSTRVSGVRIWCAASRTKPRLRRCATSSRSRSRLNSRASADNSSPPVDAGRRRERSSGATAAIAAPSWPTGRRAPRASAYPATRLARMISGAARARAVASASASRSIPSVELHASTENVSARTPVTSSVPAIDAMRRPGSPPPTSKWPVLPVGRPASTRRTRPLVSVVA